MKAKVIDWPKDLRGKGVYRVGVLTAVWFCVESVCSGRNPQNVRRRDCIAFAWCAGFLLGALPFSFSEILSKHFKQKERFHSLVSAGQ